MLKHPHPLDDVMDSFNLSNVVLGPTCFRNVENPSLVDVRRLTNVLNVLIGISDFHNFISVATKMYKLNNTVREIAYRSYQRFNKLIYLHDLNSAPFYVSDVFNDVDDQYGFYNGLERNHGPPWTVKARQLPYMNDKLSKAINVKGNLGRKYQKIKSSHSWNTFRNSEIW